MMFMHQGGYVIGFVVVVLVGCLGAFLGGRLLWQNLQGTPQTASTWTPPDDVAAAMTSAPGAAAGTPAPAAQNGPTPPAVIRVTLTQIVVPTVLAPTPDLSTPTPDPYAPTLAPYEPLTSTTSLTPTVTVTVEPAGVQYVLANPVRHSSGDCPGNYILGHVVDAKGNPLPNITLLLVDEYGNQETKVSKAGAAEAGRYDFPLFGAPRKFTLAIIDASGRLLSTKIEVPVGSGTAVGMTCHWVDFRKR
jgi:hypothetical protein